MIKANKWFAGIIDRNGFSTYAKVGLNWFSVNGTCPQIEEIRWQVMDQTMIERLEASSRDC